MGISGSHGPNTKIVNRIHGVMFFFSGSMALIMRSELFHPGMQLMQPDFYNQMVTLHGLIMIFGVIMPAFAGLANWQIPLMIGAPDMAF
ncbi:MAG: cbb3-type cytochrome c oxidase subunit I, partial [Candidatus Hydrogenedentes bacterium]|nr:cbb3-type cytochrome c oxidase subunit I [Candidatus Hydrogenedentota bacterium]